MSSDPLIVLENRESNVFNRVYYVYSTYVLRQPHLKQDALDAKDVTQLTVLKAVDLFVIVICHCSFAVSNFLKFNQKNLKLFPITLDGHQSRQSDDTIPSCTNNGITTYFITEIYLKYIEHHDVGTEQNCCSDTVKMTLYWSRYGGCVVDLNPVVPSVWDERRLGLPKLCTSHELLHSVVTRDPIYNGTGNSAHYRLAYADFRSGTWTVASCGGE